MNSPAFQGGDYKGGDYKARNACINGLQSFLFDNLLQNQFSRNLAAFIRKDKIIDPCFTSLQINQPGPGIIGNNVIFVNLLTQIIQYGYGILLVAWCLNGYPHITIGWIGEYIYFGHLGDVINSCS